jgi:hypothetical protein
MEPDSGWGARAGAVGIGAGPVLARSARREPVGFQNSVRRIFGRLGREVIFVDEAAEDRIADDR